MVNQVMIVEHVGVSEQNTGGFFGRLLVNVAATERMYELQEGSIDWQAD